MLWTVICVFVSEGTDLTVYCDCMRKQTIKNSHMERMWNKINFMNLKRLLQHSQTHSHVQRIQKTLNVIRWLSHREEKESCMRERVWRKTFIMHVIVWVILLPNVAKAMFCFRERVCLVVYWCIDVRCFHGFLCSLVGAASGEGKLKLCMLWFDW